MPIQQPGPLTKVLVIAGSLLLGSGFVLYRAGALDHVFDASHSVALAEAQLAYGTPDTSQPRTVDSVTATSGNDTVRTRFFGGSKSLAPLIEPGDTVVARSEPIDTQPRRERFMGGSKSLAPLIEPTTTGDSVVTDSARTK